MKLLTVTIPAYNSQDYLYRSVESLITGGEDVEILIVDDGSTDRTGEIADEYAAKYPSIVKAIHKENGGHGSAVNTGLEYASGIFFKVVDSDDWVKQSAYMKILETLREIVKSEKTLDLMITNFVYEKVGENRKKVMSYRHIFPQNEIFSWSDVGHFSTTKYILMHSVIYRTKLLKEAGLKLPEHTFYVDNLFVFEPLPYVKSMYYLDVNFYRYFIGREDQSVNEAVMIARIDQQIFVNKCMVDFFAENHSKIYGNKKLRRYMQNYLDIITTVSSIMLIRSGTETNLEKKKELWEYIKRKDKCLFQRLRFGILGNSMNLPGKGGRKISVEGYLICQRIFNFN